MTHMLQHPQIVERLEDLFDWYNLRLNGIDNERMREATIELKLRSFAELIKAYCDDYDERQASYNN